MPEAADPAGAKAAIRAAALERRRALPPEVCRTLSLAIVERLSRLEAYRSAEAVHTYIDARDGEVETRELVRRALRAGKRVICPRVEREPRRLEHYAIASLHDLTEGDFGLWEPDPARSTRVEASEAGLIVVPGIAFDRAGWRIGYGAGFYDRFLARVEAPKAALAYSMQLVSEVPREAHDIPVDWVLTESETIDCRALRG